MLIGMQTDAVLRDAPPPETPRGIPSLDGLRAMSILVVIGSHVLEAFHSRLPAGVGSRTLVESLVWFGPFGVEVFFVISGFLITMLLLREMERSGSISLPRFYLRRTLRIFPAYFAYLGFVAILGAGGWVANPETRWWPALTYSSNIFYTNSWLTGHSWSLSIEEQFYLVWPPALLLLGRRRAAGAILTVFCAVPIVRLLFHFVLHTTWTVGPVFGYDAIMAGCLLALFRPSLARSERWTRLLGARHLLLLPLLAAVFHLIFTARMRWLWVADLVLVKPFEAIALAVTLAWCVKNAGGGVGRLLNAWPMRRIGVLSYSLYLWQQIFLQPSWPFIWWLAPVAALAVAMVSYGVIERPFLRLRGVVERRWNRARAVSSAMQQPAPAPTVGTAGPPP